MKKFGIPSVPAAVLLGGMVITGLPAAASAADVTIVSETTLKGLPEAAINAAVSAGDGDGSDVLKAPVVTKAYFKNDKTRTETGKIVVIFDGATSTTYTLNPAEKTYTAITGVPSLPGGGGATSSAAAANPMLSLMKINVKTFVNPGNQTKIIAGQTTKNTRFMAVIKMNFAGGEAAKSAGIPANLNQMMPTIILKGEEWMAEGLLPEGVKNQNAATGMASLTQMMPFMGAGFKDFAAKLAAIKGIPLASTLSNTFQFPEGAASMMGGMFPKDPIVVTTQATSVTTEPLDDALFAPPAYYKKVDALSPPAQPAPPAAIPPASI